jgi:hypothetical protein
MIKEKSREMYSEKVGKKEQWLPWRSIEASYCLCNVVNVDSGFRKHKVLRLTLKNPKSHTVQMCAQLKAENSLN